MCPINEWGRVRPELYEPFRQVVKVYQAMAPAEAEKLTVSAVTFDVLQQAAQQPGQEMLAALYQAGLEYEFFDPACTPWTKPLMFYAGGAWLGAAAQGRLLRYIEEGGHLVLLGSYPRLDDQGQPLNRLDIPEPAGLLGHGEAFRFDLNLAGQPVSVRSFTAAWFDAPPGEPIVATRRRGEILHQEELALIVDLVEGAQYTLGFTRRVGRGRLTFIGLEPSPELILVLHEFAGVTAPARALTPDACAALFRRGDAFFLVVTNAGNENKVIEIALDVSLFAADRYQLEDLVRGDATRVNREQLARTYVSLPRKDATVVRIIPTH
jgi:hypothetical protein